MRQVTIIRHGATKLNSNGAGGDSPECIRGWANIPLSDKGRKEAQEMTPAIKDCALDGLISSDLDRALETAKIISSATKLHILGVSLGLRPWNVGKFTGSPVSECAKHLKLFAEHQPSHPLPGGESFNNFKHRTLTELRLLLEAFPSMHLGLVTHHRVERLLAAWDSEDQPKNFDVDLGVFAQKGEPTGSLWTLRVHDEFARNEQRGLQLVGGN